MFIWIRRSCKQLLVQRTDGGDSMSNGRLVSSSSKYSTLPERRVEIACKLPRTVLDEEVKAMLLFWIAAPRNVYGIGTNATTSMTRSARAQ